MRAVFLCLSIFLSLTLNAQVQFIDLTSPVSAWKFRELNTKQWFPAKVPGSVYRDLQRNGIIPDPFQSCNEQSVAWVSEKSWEYFCEFDLDKAQLKKSFIILNLEGLDTYADIFINGKKIATSKNMFIPVHEQIKSFVISGKNSLRIVFNSLVSLTIDYGKTKLPGGKRVYVRKAQFQYGWDWAPTLPDIGIWKKCNISLYDNAIDMVSLHTLSASKEGAALRLHCFTQMKSFKKYRITLNEKGSEKLLLDTVVQIKREMRLPFYISNPRLWWCNNLGSQELYEFEMKIWDAKQLIAERDVHGGIRTIELERTHDFAGEGFGFKLNGVPVYCKGANWVPTEYFPSDITYEKLKSLIAMAKSSGMNMLRVWGGGVYESEKFYRLCDENGIMVWQDFMFACGMYPGDSAFLKTVRDEIYNNSIEISGHPSLALFCGNNENQEGWFNWGWQKEFSYSKVDSIKIWNDYQNLFHSLIPSVLKKTAPEIPYWPSSPSLGWGHEKAYRTGDVHYWGVWWGNQKFETYRNKVGRFNSEYGFQALPVRSSINQFVHDSLDHFTSADLQCHQKHPRGFEIIDSAMKWYLPPAKDFNAYIAQSQFLQGKALKLAIESHRNAKPYNRGTLLWQYNDCWPVISWSIVDYFLKPKATYYQVRRSYANRYLGIEPAKNYCSFIVSNDSQTNWLDSAFIYVMDYSGKVFYEKAISFNLTAGESKTVSSTDWKNFNFLPAADKLIYFISRGGGTNVYYFSSEKDAPLRKPEIFIRRVNDSTIEVSASVVARHVELVDKNGLLQFEDNFFDIIPGFPVKVKIVNDDLKNVNDILVKTLFDTFK